MADITLFDLDGVLTRGNTMASLVSRRLARHPVRLLRAAPLFLLSLAAHPQSRLRANVNRRLVALALKGLTEDDYTELAIRTGRQLAAKRRFAVGQTITLCRPPIRGPYCGLLPRLLWMGEGFYGFASPWWGEGRTA